MTAGVSSNACHFVDTSNTRWEHNTVDLHTMEKRKIAMENPAKFTTTLVTIFCLFFAQVTMVTANNQTALMAHLFTNYESRVRPVCGADRPIEVKVGVAIRQIIELDEPKQILYLNAWIRLSWFDCQLAWIPTQYGNISSVIVPYKTVWAPDITLYDNSQGAMPGLTEYRVSVSSTGDMTYNFPTVISVLCSIDVTYFPFDTQKCALQFGSWAHHGFEIDLTNRSATGDIGSFVVNSEFDITAMPLERHVIIYGCCPEPYPDVTFYVYLKRKPMFYVLNLLFPCIIITSMSVLGFLLPPESGEKISLEITVLLSLAVFLLVVSETLPATSETFPWIGVYFACAMILVSVSTVLTVMVLNVHHKNYRPVPRWIKVLILRYAARVVFFTDTGTCRRIQVQQTNSDFTHQNGLSGKHAIHHSQINEGFDDVDEDKAGLPQLNGSSRPMSALGEETPVPGNTDLGPLVQVLQEQLRLLKKAEERKKSKERHEIQDNEWRNVAIVLDRVFLMLFLFCFTITSLVVLVPLAEKD